MTALIYSTFPDLSAAQAVTSALLDEKLIVCSNTGAAIASLFEWQGERHSEQETAVLFKTDAGLAAQAVARLEQLHPYEAPAIFGWRCDFPGKATRNWTGGLREGADGNG